MCNNTLYLCPRAFIETEIIKRSDITIEHSGLKYKAEVLHIQPIFCMTNLFVYSNIVMKLGTTTIDSLGFLTSVHTQASCFPTLSMETSLTKMGEA